MEWNAHIKLNHHHHWVFYFSMFTVRWYVTHKRVFLLSIKDNVYIWGLNECVTFDALTTKYA